MSWLNVVVTAYALLNIGGGIAGFVAKSSVPSLISGVVAGILLLVGVYLTTNNPRRGYILCAVVAVGDLGFFGPNLAKGFVLWPAGIMAACSILVLACLAFAHFGAKTGA